MDGDEMSGKGWEMVEDSQEMVMKCHETGVKY